MTGLKKPQPTSKDALAKASPEGSIELSESQLSGASGGAVFPSSPAVSSLKYETSVKLDTNPALLLPAVKTSQP